MVPAQTKENKGGEGILIHQGGQKTGYKKDIIFGSRIKGLNLLYINMYWKYKMFPATTEITFCSALTLRAGRKETQAAFMMVLNKFRKGII